MKHFLLEIAERTRALNLLQHVGNGVGHRLYVLHYHRIDDPVNRPWLDPTLISATPAQFAEQMSLVARYYHPVSIDDVLDTAMGGKPLPANAVLVTFDDGYRDFKEVVFPILKKHAIRPVLFVPTAYVGKGKFWWDKLYYAIYRTDARQVSTPEGQFAISTPDEKQQSLNVLAHYVKKNGGDGPIEMVDNLYRSALRYYPNGHPDTLGWDDLRRLAGEGVTIAGHTHTHPILRHITAGQARSEVRLAQEIIQREIGQSLPVFALPEGRQEEFSPDLVNYLWEDGYKLVFTMAEGCVRLNRDNLLWLPRLGVAPSMSLGQFHYHLTPLYSRVKYHDL